MESLFIPVILGFITSVGLFLVVLVFSGGQPTVKVRVDRFLDSSEDQSPGFRERVIRPLWVRISRLGNAVYPSKVIERLDLYCLHAGRPLGLRGERLAGLKLFLALSLGAASFLLLPGVARLLGACGVGAIGYALPGIWIQGRIKKRFTLARSQLADAMDLLVVSVEAGLGLDMAMSRVADRLEGPIGQVFKRALSEIRLGETRERALKGIVHQLPLQEIRHFVNSLVQAEQLGISLGSVLRSQAETLRVQRRLKAEEQARKAPVKMLFPLILFIFPSLFVVILGPAFIKIVQELADK